MVTATGKFDYFLWRTSLKWKDAVAAASAVVDKWNTLTPFVQSIDQRDGVWIARHGSTAAPFFQLREDSLRGSVPRVGDPLAALLLLCLVRAHGDKFRLTFTDGQPIDAAKLVPEELAALLPHANHAVFRKLLIAGSEPPAPPPPPPAA
jgi:hypothetical protein